MNSVDLPDGTSWTSGVMAFPILNCIIQINTPPLSGSHIGGFGIVGVRREMQVLGGKQMRWDLHQHL